MAVYLIRAGDSGPVKIGWADDVAGRRKELQTAHYEKLVEIRVIESRRDGERWLHEVYNAKRIRGEWFHFCPSMLEIELSEFAEMDAIGADALDPILPEIEATIKATGITATAFGIQAAADPQLVHELRRGRELRRTTRARVREFIVTQTAQPVGNPSAARAA